MLSINPTSSGNGNLPRLASLIAVTAAFLVTASRPLIAAHPTSEWPTIQWRAMPELDLEKSGTNCATRLTEPVDLVFDGKILKSTAWSGMTYDIILQEPLNADGSGTVQAVSMPRGRTMMLEFQKFDPERRPPTVTFYGLYTAIKGHGRCVWNFRPLVDVD